MKKLIILAAVICAFAGMNMLTQSVNSLGNTTSISESGDTVISFSQDAKVVTINSLPCMVKSADGDYHQICYLQDGGILYEVLPHITFHADGQELIERLDYGDHVREYRHQRME